MKKWVPIYEKDGNKLVIAHSQFAGEDEEEANRIGLGSMFVECILLGMKFTGEVREIDTENLPHVKATLGPYYAVCIIEGPMFQEADSAQQATESDTTGEDCNNGRPNSISK